MVKRKGGEKGEGGKKNPKKRLRLREQEHGRMDG